MPAVFLILTLSASCSLSNTDSIQNQFKNDSYYFLGLRALENNDEKSAKRLFTSGAKKASSLAAMKSAQALTLLGNVREREDASRRLAKKYSDTESLLAACQELFSQNEYGAVISFTDNINLTEEYDESKLQNQNALIRLRMESLYHKNDRRLEEEFFTWIMNRPVSSAHYSIYRQYLEHEIKSSSEDDDSQSEQTLTEKQRLILFRINVFARNYRPALEDVQNILELYTADGRNPDTQILSDIGKAALYGSINSADEAARLERLARTMDSQSAFYMNFYSARLYEKAGRYQAKAISNYLSALKNAPGENEFDNCLWYLLNMQLRTNTDDIISTLNAYFNQISEPEYFDDFFDSLSMNLLYRHKWQEFYEIWKIMDGKASERSSCKYAYISGRLLEEGLASSTDSADTREAVNAFIRVLTGSSSLYYKVCALERLNITEPSAVSNYIHSSGNEVKTQSDTDAEQLLAGYAAFGFPQKIYGEWLKYRDSVSLESSVQAASFLNQCGNYNSAYSTQSLRIAGRLMQNVTGKIPDELFELTFPRFYSDVISKACIEFDVPEYLMYSLIRTESFFDSSITSSAGANGLTQLMRSTADDEARKLKLPEEYDILDPETNVRIGTHYLKSLIERADSNSVLLALFAYNAGLTNVRKWVRDSRNDWISEGKTSKSPAGISLDLFLETLPFSETIDYGRKLIEASALYGYIYYGITPAQTVRQFLY